MPSVHARTRRPRRSRSRAVRHHQTGCGSVTIHATYDNGPGNGDPGNGDPGNGDGDPGGPGGIYDPDNLAIMVMALVAVGLYAAHSYG